SYARFMQLPDQTIYLLKDSEMNNGNGSVLGFIKTGRKRLFLTDNRTLLHEVEPLCIMDFYVHETQQRRGHGKELFENVLQEEGLSAFEVAIDRPSSKFLSFLQRHYQLSSYVKQNNNFVIFDKFFTTCSHVDHGRGMHRRHSLPSSMHANTNGVTAGRSRGLRMSLSPLKNNE
uniref:N-acetyltransferase domain-containing protein n=1 Tax=Amphimedon queenslandica TaxID=400682 RepID=A0A1X7SI81_AMPQE